MKGQCPFPPQRNSLGFQIDTANLPLLTELHGYCCLDFLSEKLKLYISPGYSSTRCYSTHPGISTSDEHKLNTNLILRSALTFLLLCILQAGKLIILL